MSKQTEAQRLAEALDAVPENGADPDLIADAAKELRRLDPGISDIKDGGPAFPHTVVDNSTNFDPDVNHSGLSIRDYFAVKAMQGMMHDVTNPNGEAIAEWAYRVADAMLRAREAK